MLGRSASIILWNIDKEKSNNLLTLQEDSEELENNITFSLPSVKFFSYFKKIKINRFLEHMKLDIF